MPPKLKLISRQAEIIANNRMKLRSIAATIILCGRQALAFRGYHEDRFDVEESDRAYLCCYFALMLSNSP